tara:strand:- start:529 stop:942 length:414 start_codon:yes stop_codon:yes gene_type:complete
MATQKQEKIIQEIANFKARIKPTSSTLFKKVINDKIKKLEDRLKKLNATTTPTTSPVTTTKVGEGTVLKNKASEATAFLKAASKVMNEIQVQPETEIQVKPKTRTAMRDKIRGSARIGFKTRAKGTNIGDFKRKIIK